MPGDKWPKHELSLTSGGRLTLVAVVLAVAAVALLPFASLIRG